MRYNAVIHLVGTEIIEDEIGNQIEQETERQVFANEMSVGQAEYYNAAVSGLRPEKRFEVYTFEYANERQLKHNGIKYRIIRTETRGEKTRITCERVAGDG
ncbi:phage head closure protein [Melghirimyces algeriensis]|uniref:Phage head-tail adaptor, putative, SPP1 family n=1 Tax=Melghirimyces algeriensis TaxID=910412 RepID=A0A521C6E1_9BACL|nr:phage head closure protein [Melghirimyces algeriensis]SMO54999.1 phage head-tail adaptor, putative, SPP1 family [Melghirimyces algeriensis]